MNVDDFPEDSDSSDEDYVPDGKQEVLSEEDSDGQPEEPLSGSEEQKDNKTKKRKKKTVKTKKKLKKDTEKEAEVVPDVKQEDSKRSADDLWADFMKDTGFKPKNSLNASSNKSNSNPNENISTKKTEEKTITKDKSSQKATEKVKITQVFDFAGEEVKVEKEVDANSAEARLLADNAPKTSNQKPKKTGGLSGISNVLSQLGKKPKISTLEKSKLDWDRFKKEENIEEELSIHNKGKDGYLEKQDFLQRADLRRFEIEKSLRDVERNKRFNSAL